METSRRDLMGLAIGGLGVIGALGVLYPIVKTLAPSAASLAGALVEVDVNSIPEGQVRVVSWKGKPVFVVKLPQGLQWGGKAKEEKNSKLLQGQNAFALVAVCTHLGCVPLWKPQGEAEFNYPVFHCPCHGGFYSPWGDVVAGPPPRALHIPPQAIRDGKLLIGEPGFIKELT
ncbi:MAG: ubiquinol-cytochrome c reductase iron-sulfur subunit [Aquificaceae bacterium]|nr:ubiquinol-cytochrome c reductase iron-sulfur subunit [Aquificaceae bacterium]MCS7195812.1 ubiquinol-cytochrome c reductase iron-sulfur subunit [Aquificaceae bacterium]MDW8032654.1 ubiquinol-cytochrome c reductase iron-sulfur subunit [Aquificaceae bacterium]MDW8293764.1 ubiquinol-cytochrome c reductase iron-sulfur subunit [Aquificaceae bacterium]